MSRSEKTDEIRDRDTNCGESWATGGRLRHRFAICDESSPPLTHCRRFTTPLSARNLFTDIMDGASRSLALSMGMSLENQALQTCDAQNGRFQKTHFAQNGRFRCRIPQLPPLATAAKRGKHKRHGKDAKTDLKSPPGKGSPGGRERKRERIRKAYLAASFFLPSADLSPLFGMTQNLSSG